MSEEREAWAQNSRQSVEALLGGDKVEALGAFQGPEKEWVGSELLTLIRWIGRASQSDARRHLDDFPTNFLLAVTEDKVHVFEYYGRSSKPKIKHAADYDRDSITIATEPSDVVVLELRDGAGTERLRLMGSIPDKERNPSAANVVAALSD